MSESESQVELGFLEECEPWQVESRLFPSKVGGKPAWLNLANLPTVENLQCKICLKTMIFLCQIYAPYEENMQISPDQYFHNFHRTLFLFICRNPTCCDRNNSENIKVLRSCLPRGNTFYSYDPPEEKPFPEFSINKWANLCNVCGCLSEKQCSKCKKIYYCCREHQILDWKEGHKEECCLDMVKNRKSTLLFPQYEIITETEEFEIRISNEDVEYEKFLELEREGRIGTMVEVSENELDNHATSEHDKMFSKFQKRVNQNPSQCIRYKRGGEPLWIAKEPIPINIPHCEYCQGPRQYEFQIMPQMLALLKETDLDWGVIVIYTCVASCSDNNIYKEEFVIKQDVEIKDI